MVRAERNYEAHALIGGRGQGKSSYARKLFDAYDLRSQRILVLTATLPPAYKDITEVKDINQLKRWKRGMVRYYNHESPKQMLKDIHDLCVQGYIRNGLVIFEDCTNYIDPWPAESIRQFLVNCRMFQLDLIFTTHALAFLPKFVRRMVNTITVFKTAETFETPKEVKQLGYPNYEAVYDAWQECMRAPKNNRSYVQHYVTIETGI
jgi:hypothetical protein